MDEGVERVPDEAPTVRRFPMRVYGAGREPDPRFSLANERTFLAWIRTSLALVAAGVALEALELPIAEGLRLASALVFIVLGLLAPAQAWLGWAATERAMRQGRPLPAPRLGVVLAGGTTVAGLLVLAGLLLR
ncbi:YidH family protein [Modestobacter sp. VKM Ac-2984]|uniref:YidH family protein n=1 Tax=Modestobacter sp. VKM Ac-2984 TaxID=3004138 RepID=UPI002F26B5FB